jgi:formate hydrogenlyase subunit 5
MNEPAHSPATKSAREADPLHTAIAGARDRGADILDLYRSDGGVMAAALEAGDPSVHEIQLGSGPFIRPSHYGVLGYFALEVDDQRADWWVTEFPIDRVSGRGIHVMPLGPVRADVAESLRYVLTVFGDDIHHVRLVPGYKHRHVEQAIGRQDVRQGIRVAERVTGTSPVAHAWAYAMAVEHALNISVPPAALLERTCLAELERLMSHLGDLAALAASTGTITASADLYTLKEKVLRFNQARFGHRYLRGRLEVGGGSSRPSGQLGLAAFTADVEREFNRVRRALDHTNSFLDRLHGAGRLADPTHLGLRVTGFVGKSAGQVRDLRWDRPYGAYDGDLLEGLEPVGVDAPDAYGRYLVRVEEVLQSFEILRRLEGRAPQESTSEPEPAFGAGVGFGLVEAPRGRLVYRVGVRGMEVRGVRIATPSSLNWPAVPVALAAHNILQDFPIIDASFSLSVAGLDL